MTRQIIASAGLMSDLVADSNANFAEIYTKTEIENSYASLYIPAPEALTVVAGTPMSLGSIAVVGASNFTYIDNHLRYDGDEGVIVKVDGAVSMTSGTNNIITTISFAKNGNIGDAAEVASRIDRKIATGADVGAVPIAGTFTLTNGDYLDFYVDSNINSVVTVTRANFTIHTLKLA